MYCQIISWNRINERIMSKDNRRKSGGLHATTPEGDVPYACSAYLVGYICICIIMIQTITLRFMVQHRHISHANFWSLILVLRSNIDQTKEPKDRGVNPKCMTRKESETPSERERESTQCPAFSFFG